MKALKAQRWLPLPPSSNTATPYTPLCLGIALNLAFVEMSSAEEIPLASETLKSKGIQQGLAVALNQARASSNVVDIIIAEELGRMPEHNLAEVLDGVAGVQITREAGVGTALYIRGLDAHRAEINGVYLPGSNSERKSTNWEDLSPSLFSKIEIIKSPVAKTIEGGSGGTVNLITVRPLDLERTAAALHVEAQHNSLSSEGQWQPRVSAHWGDHWDAGAGRVGVMLNAAYEEQKVTAFRPRADRDNLITANSGADSAQDFDYLPIQFLVQDYDSFDYETFNAQGTIEWAPSEQVRVYLDGTVVEQNRQQYSSRVQASGVSSLASTVAPEHFSMVDFGSLNGENGTQQLGQIHAAERGVFPAQSDGLLDPNLRMSSDTRSRESHINLFSLGTDWSFEQWTGKFELSHSNNKSTYPDFSSTLNFINPNTPTGETNDNATPIEYDLSGGALAFGIAQGESNAPTSNQLLTAANYRLRDVLLAHDQLDNTENALRADFSYRIDQSIWTSVDAGYRYSDTQSERNEARSAAAFRTLDSSPSADLFSNVVAPGPNNYNAADGRSLYISDFLLIDPKHTHADPDGVISTLNAAIAANNAQTGADAVPISMPFSQPEAYYKINEKTHALYAQVNFDAGIVRGDAGLRYFTSDIEAMGNQVADDDVELRARTHQYSDLLPRINLVAPPHENLEFRASWSQDIIRPDFDDLSPSLVFSTSPYLPVETGNPELQPEEVTSYDIGAQWYFAPDSVASVTYFNKRLNNLIVPVLEEPAIDPDTGARDRTPPCEQGGVYNPITDQSVFPPPGTPSGMCVPVSYSSNTSGSTSLSGIELALQYDLSYLEGALGWASGFGVLANYTWQEYDGDDRYLPASNRASEVFAINGAYDVTMKQPLLDNAENSYDVSLYYEKYGLSARARYSWQDAFYTADFGSTETYPWGFPVVQEARGQWNASVRYAINNHIEVGIEGVNLTESAIEQSCVNSGALPCFQGLTERSISFGIALHY